MSAPAPAETFSYTAAATPAAATHHQQHAGADILARALVDAPVVPRGAGYGHGHRSSRFRGSGGGGGGGSWGSQSHKHYLRGVGGHGKPPPALLTRTTSEHDEELAGGRAGRTDTGSSDGSSASEEREGGDAGEGSHRHHHHHHHIGSLRPLPEALKTRFSCKRATPAPELRPNQTFIEQLKKIRTVRELTADKIGVRAYSTAIAAIAATPWKLSGPEGRVPILDFALRM